MTSDSNKPRAYWRCDDCGIGSSWWYEKENPMWDCPKCKKEYEPREIEGKNDK